MEAGGGIPGWGGVLDWGACSSLGSEGFSISLTQEPEADTVRAEPQPGNALEPNNVTIIKSSGTDNTPPCPTSPDPGSYHLGICSHDKLVFTL